MRPEDETRALVIGAGGQLGQELLRAVWPAGWRKLGLARDVLDVTDRAACRRAVAAAMPAIVINAAAMTAVDRAETAPDSAFAVNAEGARNIAEASAECGAPLIQLSTDYVFDGAKDAPYDEADRVNPLNVYGSSKLAGEAAVLRASPVNLVVRTSWVFGASGANFVKTMLRLGAEREVLRVVADQRGCPTAAADLALALVRLAELMVAPRGGEWPAGILNVAGGGATTWHGFATAILDGARCRRAGRVAEVRPIATEDYPTPARRPASSVLDCARARVLGVALPPWEEGLARVLDEFLPAQASFSTASSRGRVVAKS